MNTYDYEDALFRIHSRLRDFYNLKEFYIHFSNRNAGNPIATRSELADIIKQFHSCEHESFESLQIHSKNIKIPLSFLLLWLKNMIMVKYMTFTYPTDQIEALNRKVKDLKRLGRGYKNFKHFRNHFLYSTLRNLF